MRLIVDREWKALNQSKPEPLILWKFIEEERNNVLKAYRGSARQHVTVRPPTTHINLTTGEETESGGGPTLYSHVMADGPLAGQDPRDLVERGIEWWSKYLARIDRLAALS
jgi:hypothetical protein